MDPVDAPMNDAAPALADESNGAAAASQPTGGAASASSATASNASAEENPKPAAFTLGSKALDVLRGDRSIVDDDTGRLHRGATRRCADIVNRRRCEFRQRSDIVEQTYETTSHGSKN